MRTESFQSEGGPAFPNAITESLVGLSLRSWPAFPHVVDALRKRNLKVDLEAQRASNLEQFIKPDKNRKFLVLLEKNQHPDKPKVERKDFLVMVEKRDGKEIVAIFDYQDGQPKLKGMPFLPLRLAFELTKNQEHGIYDAETEKDIRVGVIQGDAKIDGWIDSKHILLKDLDQEKFELSSTLRKKTELPYGSLWQALENQLDFFRNKDTIGRALKAAGITKVTDIPSRVRKLYQEDSPALFSLLQTLPEWLQKWLKY